MLVVKMTGQLGNQMFQYAIYRKLQFIGRHPKIDMSYYESFPAHNHIGVFNLNLEIASPSECLIAKDGCRSVLDRIRRRVFGRRPVFSEIGLDVQRFQPSIFDLKKGYIDGYWQSDKYFGGIQDLLRNDFSFPVLSDSMNTMICQKIANTESVSIHVRRGDYLNGFPVMDMEYFSSAIQYIKSNTSDPVFFVFSNDIPWCRDHFRGDEFTFVDWNTGANSYYDMHLMSMCKHNIIANSTFSWWAAWLNSYSGKIVIAPSLWFYKTKNPDIYMDDWIVI